jgi:hypothetical protein
MALKVDGKGKLLGRPTQKRYSTHVSEEFVQVEAEDDHSDPISTSWSFDLAQPESINRKIVAFNFDLKPRSIMTRALDCNLH